MSFSELVKQAIVLKLEKQASLGMALRGGALASRALGWMSKARGAVRAIPRVAGKSLIQNPLARTALPNAAKGASKLGGPQGFSVAQMVGADMARTATKSPVATSASQFIRPQ